jgi:hypothetical protein
MDGFIAITLYPFIIINEDQWEKLSMWGKESTMKHELVHFTQQEEEGVFAFYWHYISEYVDNKKKGMTPDLAYHNISYEKEAFSLSHRERKHLDNWRLYHNERQDFRLFSEQNYSENFLLGRSFNR